MGTKNDPGITNCYAKAELDEPIFTLLGRDPAAPAAIERWADIRKRMIWSGKKPRSDMAMVQEAEDVAIAMRAWRKANRDDASDPTPSEPEGER